MATLESRIIAKVFPKDTKEILGGLMIPIKNGQEAEALDIAFQLFSTPASLEAPILLDNDNPVTLANIVGITEDTAAEMAAEKERTVQIVELLNELSDTERKVIYLKYFEGLSNTEIGEKFGKSRDFASKIHNAVLAKWRNDPTKAHLKEFLS